MILPVFVLPVFVLSVFVCMHFLPADISACRHILLALADMPAWILSAQDLGGLHSLSVGLVAPSQNRPQHQTNY